MKKLISLLTLLVVVSLPVAAGDINAPGYVPPPCTPNCGAAPMIDEGDLVLFFVRLAY